MPIVDEQEFRDWESRATVAQRGDPVWRFNAYRVSLFLLERAGDDAKHLRRRKAVPFQTDQMLRAVASVSANIAEGLGRRSASERSQFFGVALGSLRECMVWYQAVSSDLPDGIHEARIDQLTELRKILIGAQKWLSSKGKGTQLM